MLTDTKIAKYPKLRNYKKRCELQEILYNISVEYEKESRKFIERLDNDNLTDEEFDNIKEIENKTLSSISDKFFKVVLIQRSLEFPNCKNEWLVNIFCKSFVEGEHKISKKQLEIFLRYAEEDEYTYKTYERYLNANGYFITVNSFGYVKFEKIPSLDEI